MILKINKLDDRPMVKLSVRNVVLFYLKRMQYVLSADVRLKKKQLKMKSNHNR
jgi:hypothetical protein